MAKRICQVLLWVITVVGVPVLVVILSLPPDQVISNLSKWMHWIGISNVPKWVSNPSVDRIVILSIVLIYVAVIIWRVVIWRQASKIPAIEVIFDTKNGGHQFWQLKNDVNGNSGIQYRAKVLNRTNKTMREVKATIESVGQMGIMPARLIFDQTGESTFTLDPGAAAFINLFFALLPITQPGTLVAESATAAYGPIRVTVSALDIEAVERLFQFKPISLGFDPYEEPMIS